MILHLLGKYMPTAEEPLLYLNYLANKRPLEILNLITAEYDGVGSVNETDLTFAHFEQINDVGEVEEVTYSLNVDLNRTMKRLRGLSKRFIRDKMFTGDITSKLNYFTAQIDAYTLNAKRNHNVAVEEECKHMKLLIRCIANSMLGKKNDTHKLSGKKSPDSTNYIKINNSCGLDAEAIAVKLICAPGFDKIMDASKEQLIALFSGQQLSDNKIVWKLRSGSCVSTGTKYILKFIDWLGDKQKIDPIHNDLKKLQSTIVYSFSKYDAGDYNKRSVKDAFDDIQEKNNRNGTVSNDTVVHKLHDFLRAAFV